MKQKIALTIKFELLYHFATVLVFTPLFSKGLLLLMHLAGFSFLTNRNIFSFLSNPVGLAGTILFGLVVSAYSILDICGILFIWNCNEQLNFKTVSLYALSRIRVVFSLRNCLILFWMLVFLPFLNVALVSNAVSLIRIPPYLLEYLRQLPVLQWLFWLLLFLLCLLMIRTLYLLPNLILKNESFIQAFKSSWLKTRRHTFSCLFFFVLVQLFITLFCYGGIYLGSAIIYLCHLPFQWLLFTMTVAFFTSMALPMNYICISYLYKKNESVSVNYPYHRESKTFKLSCALIFILFLGLYSLYTCKLFNPPENHHMEIAAHRGNTKNSPENSLAAFF